MSKERNDNEGITPVKVTWECGKCGSVQESYSDRRWEMDVCECGHSGYDLEMWYSRSMGAVKILKTEQIENKDE